MTRKHYYKSEKAGEFVCDSSYELKASIILDNDENILTYETHRGFKSDKGKKRIFDFLITKKDGSKTLIEVKPIKRLLEFKDQIDDNLNYAQKCGYNFEVWTESNLGFKDSEDARKWFINQEIKKNPNYLEFLKQLNREKAKRHYDKKISKNKTTFFCGFCKEEHTILQITYDRNVAKNGRFICIKENGHIVGSNPKPHLKKDNPYADEGKKQCTKCQRIIPFECFGKDKSRSDDYASRCKKCRAAIAKEKYID